MSTENKNEFSLDVVGEMSNFSSPLHEITTVNTNKASIFVENVSTVEPIFEPIKPYSEKSDSISLGKIEDIEASLQNEENQISKAAQFQETLLNPKSSQEQIYKELNTVNSWLNQMQADLNSKADVISNEEGVIQSRYPISSENIMFFDRLAKTNNRFSWA